MPRRSQFARTLQLCAAAASLFLAGAAQAENGKVWVAADFDGDNIADLVTITSGPASVQFGPLSPSVLSLPSGLSNHRLLARDVDGDSDRDLILESSSSELIAVWLNDGFGNFRPADLGKFQFQLGNRGHQHIAASDSFDTPDVLDDIPGHIAPPSHPAEFEIPNAIRRYSTAQITAQSALHFTAYTRGPPQIS